MINYRIAAVIKRELREKLMSKSFIIMTLLVPVFMFGIVGLQVLMVAYKGDKGTRLELVTESDSLTGRFREYLAAQDFIQDGTYVMNYGTVQKKSLEKYIEGRKNDLLSGEISGIIYIPSTALETKRVEYYSKTPNNSAVFEKLDSHINEVLIDRYFSEKDLTEEELNFARRGVRFNGFKVSEKEGVEAEGFGKTVLAMLFSFLIYFSVIFSSSATLNSVLEEKNSRVVEVLLSSVNSRELMTGKILGCTITMFVQMVIWLLPVVILTLTTWISLPEWWPDLDIGYGHFIYFLINFFLACIIFQGLSATVGASFDNHQEAQSGFFPVILLIMIPFFLSFSMLRNPDNPIAAAASYVPFATLMVMPFRSTIVDMPVWKLVVSQLVNVATILLIFPLAGKIYRVGILRSGTKPTLREVIRWLKSPE